MRNLRLDWRPAAYNEFKRCLRPNIAMDAMNSATYGELPFEVPQSKARYMTTDRIKGSVKQAKGRIKEVAGKATGDAKLETEGKADKIAGKVQNAIGGARDAIRGK
jgi:uncharacterized protein YjbJ (UPF0337 family)